MTIAVEWSDDEFTPYQPDGNFGGAVREVPCRGGGANYLNDVFLPSGGDSLSGADTPVSVERSGDQIVLTRGDGTVTAERYVLE